MDNSTSSHANYRNIKNIIFDFGGVIINIDYHKTILEFEKLGIASFDKMFSQATQSHLMDRLEVGAITPSEFRNELRELMQQELSDEVLDHAWNEMLLDYPKHRLDFLLQIKPCYRTFLLSNTNKIHKDAYVASLKREHGYESLDGFFEKLYFSHEVGMRKPGHDIYQLVLRENGLKAEETLFIDDTPHNLTAPAEIGINVYHLAYGEDVVDMASRMGIV